MQLKYNGDTGENFVNTLKKYGCYFANDALLNSDSFYFMSALVSILVWNIMKVFLTMMKSGISKIMKVFFWHLDSEPN